MPVCSIVNLSACSAAAGHLSANAHTEVTRPSPTTVLLTQVLQDGGEFSGQMLEATCELAIRLLIDRSQSLAKYIDSDAHVDIGRAILAKQVLQSTVQREQPVVDSKPHITWGVLESKTAFVYCPVCIWCLKWLLAVYQSVGSMFR